MLIPLVIGVISIAPPLNTFLLFSVYAASGPAVWFWRRLRRGAVSS
jgi:hypothetical protein